MKLKAPRRASPKAPTPDAKPAPLRMPTKSEPVRFAVGDAGRVPLRAGSVDLVMTSPPYEDARTYGIGFGLKGQAWVDWAVPIYLEHLRVSRGWVAWVIQGRTQARRWSGAPALFMADLIRAGVRLRRPAIYKRFGIPGSGGNDWLRSDYEFVVCASAVDRPWAEPTACGHPPKRKAGGPPSHRTRDGRRVSERLGERRTNGSRQRRRPYKPPAKSNPGDVIDCGAVGGGNMGHALAHENEAPYPLRLAEFMVRTFCPPGGVVCDPFAGSGTTGHAAVVSGRRAVLIDCRRDQINLSKRRIADVLRDRKDTP